MNFITYIFVIILKYLFKFFELILSGIQKLLYYIWLPFKWVIQHIIFSQIILPIYKIYIDINNVYKKITKTFTQWIFAPLTTRYTVHILISIIIFAVITGNIYAKELENEITPVGGDNGILLSLITPPENQLIEEYANYNIIADNKYYGSDNDYLSNTDYGVSIAINYLETVDPYTLDKPIIINTTTNLKLRNKTESYFVEGGDTLSTIAEKFGLKLTTLLEANSLSLKSNIRPGQELTILPIDGLLYTVKSGDTISKLASKYQAQTNQIKEYNKISDDSLAIGKEILIPYAVKPKPVYIAPKVTSSYTPPTTAATNTATTIVYTTSGIPANVAVSGTRLQWPTSEYVVTQYYHYGHTGLDISGARRFDAPLYASESGTVIKAQGGWNGGYGNYIIIDHGGGWQTLYAHASKIFVTPGEYVERGQAVAMMGTSGRSTGPHIHYEVRINGAKMNPLSYIR